MGRQVDDFRRKVYDEILELRALYGLLMKPWVDELYGSSTDIEKEEFLTVRTKLQLHSWICNHSSRTYHSFTHKELKVIGRKYNVPDYSRLDKMDLLVELRKRKLI